MELGNCIKSELPNPKVSQSYRQFVAKHPGRAPGTCSTKEIEDDRKRKSVSTIGTESRRLSEQRDSLTPSQAIEAKSVLIQ